MLNYEINLCSATNQYDIWPFPFKLYFKHKTKGSMVVNMTDER